MPNRHPLSPFISPQNPALTVKPSQRRSAPLLAAAAIAVLLLTLAPAAGGRPASAHKVACQSATRHPHSHQTRCARQHKPVQHRGKHHSGGKSPAHKTSPHKPPARVAAQCEDGSLPLRSAPGVFSCDDESEPGCQEGSEATLAAGGTALTCPAPVSPGGEAEGECFPEGECVPSEPPCEAGEEEELPTCTVVEPES
jgi:hypothetical protein